MQMCIEDAKKSLSFTTFDAILPYAENALFDHVDVFSKFWYPYIYNYYTMYTTDC